MTLSLGTISSSVTLPVHTTLIWQLLTNILSILFLTIAILLRSVAAASHDFNMTATYQYFVYFVSNSCFTSKICGGELFASYDFNTAATYQYFVYFVSNSCYTSKICGSCQP